MSSSRPPANDEPCPVPTGTLRAYTLGPSAVVLAFDLGGAGPREHPLLELLSEGQRRMVCLALEGYSDVEIAAHFERSRHTVANQLRRAYRRLGVNSRAELAARVRPRAERVRPRAEAESPGTEPPGPPRRV